MKPTSKGTLTRPVDTLSHPMGEGRGEGRRWQASVLKQLDSVLDCGSLLPLFTRHTKSASRPRAKAALWRGAKAGGLAHSTTLAAACLFLLTALSAHADRFGDISVSPQVMASGETYHGYREFRIFVQNHSTRRTHRVTLVFPDRPYPWGHSISRIERTISLGPETSAVVPLWQPPLPQNGNGLLRVQIAGEDTETLHFPAQPHASRNFYGHGPMPATVLVSRGLNFNDLSTVLKSGKAPLGASSATGPPDARGSRGLVPNVWSPDASRTPHWIELDYDPPVQADGLRIHATIAAPAMGDIALIGTSGSNIANILMSAAMPGPGSRPTSREFSFTRTSEPVKTVRLNFHNLYAGSIAIDAVELMDSTSGAGSAWASSARASSEVTSSPSGLMPGAEARSLISAEIPASQWSEHWLSYTPFDAVALHASDLRSIPPEVLMALQLYTEAGGNLIVFGTAELPASWRRLNRSEVPGGLMLNAGLGRCFVFEHVQPTELHSTAVKRITDTLNEAVQRWQSVPDESMANAMFPVVENARIPVRGIVFIMLGFVLLIGPVNLVVLSRMQRRTWLLWTIPAISVATSFLVFVYSLVREGFTPDVRTQTLTFLDQTSRRAVTVGTTAIYSPLTPGGGLFFAVDTEATPMVQSWGYNQGISREVGWTSGQHLSRGWVSARVPTHFSVRKAESRRERLQLEPTAEGITVINGLGADITSLWLADASGRLYQASAIPAGQKAELIRATESAGAQGPAKLRSEMALTAFNDLDISAPEFLAPGTYIAVLDGNPFVENPLGSKAASARTSTKSIVYGLLEVQP